MTTIEYVTLEGKKISYIVRDGGVTMSDIDNIACRYFEETGRVPDRVFLDLRWYSQLRKELAPTMGSLSRSRYEKRDFGYSQFTLYLTICVLPVIPIVNSHIPVLVGTQGEFEDNDFYKVFEEALKICP